MGERLFISDLHLSADRPEVAEIFFRFLRQRAARAEALYILGDLFDAWIGDDAMDEFDHGVAAALKGLSDAGTAIHLQHGNRDFLLGPTFCAASGAYLLPEHYALELAGRNALLMHGDLLCTDDQDYQQARALLRNPAFIADFLAKPVPERLALAREYRRRSGEATSLKADDIMDVNPDAVADRLGRHGASLLVHGHTHRPADHDLGQGGRRLVLGEWSMAGARCLSVRGDSIEPFHYP